MMTKKKGQVFLIIFVIIALSLVLINMKTNFDVSLKKKSLYVETNENEAFNNLQEEFRESYDVAVKQKPTDYNLNRTLANYLLFVRDRMQRSNFRVLYSFSTYDNETLNVTLHNYLGRNIENVAIEQNLTGGSVSPGDMGDGEGYEKDWSAEGKTSNYHVNITYTDSSDGKSFTKTYTGDTGDKDIYTALFYRLEFERSGTELNDEGKVKSKPL